MEIKKDTALMLQTAGLIVSVVALGITVLWAHRVRASLASLPKKQIIAVNCPDGRPPRLSTERDGKRVDVDCSPERFADKTL